MGASGLRKVKIDLNEISDAIDMSSDMVTYYLDLEAGVTVFITEETNHLLETIFQEYFHEQTEKIDWEAAYAAYKIPDWQRQELQEAHLVETSGETRFVRIPALNSREGYDAMAEFIETVKVKDARSELREAISGRGAFRRFKDALENYPELRQKWFEFKKESLRQHALDWLESEDIRLTTGPDEK
jgi:hypothetical protein